MAFCLRLAVLLHKSLEEILALSAEEIMIWATHLRDGDPDQWAELRMARICQTTAASHGVRTRLGDFLTRGPSRRRVSEETMKAMLAGWARRIGA